mmetsp:Transcript_17985/g.32609  ORF Transcript_17985/g.32609 Transcript_17985/m.32609 type:complete len:330 (-) Transcript_17985:481-1470(-)
MLSFKMMTWTRCCCFLLSMMVVLENMPQGVNGFVIGRSASPTTKPHAILFSSTLPMNDALVPESEDDNNNIDAANVAMRQLREEIKGQILSLAASTERGFEAAPSERDQMKDLILDLADTFDGAAAEPAAPYYEDAEIRYYDDDKPTLEGSWTLVYTDAPDITGLDAGNSKLLPLPPLAQLGRIGQSCKPPYITNVIEWIKPSWAQKLPSFLLPGEDTNARILQKVVTEAKAVPSRPTQVDLTLVGLDITARMSYDDDDDDTSENILQEAIKEKGLLAGFLKTNPLELRGPLTTPFGKFTILYVDDELRIIRTYQNYVTINTRNKEEWF